MRAIAWAGIVSIGLALGATGADAGVKVATRTQSYEISGKTGAALLDDMDRRGPKQGFLTRAIAQTGYSLSWTIEWAETREACRVSSVDGVLDMTYTYPVAKNLSPALQRRWNRFLSGVRRHERVHGDIARQMAKAIEKSVAKVSVRDDRGCRKARAQTKRIMAEITGDYEARQRRYDLRDHRDGGAVERLIDQLIGD